MITIRSPQNNTAKTRIAIKSVLVIVRRLRYVSPPVMHISPSGLEIDLTHYTSKFGNHSLKSSNGIADTRLRTDGCALIPLLTELLQNGISHCK
ncbi:MAG: hypothetical protein LBC02_09480 [Planctomycetaceae bacterium]|jgi:hypothetical protein|nr:hypothetical protein [Planctomycetaceae bacterium]